MTSEGLVLYVRKPRPVIARRAGVFSFSERRDCWDSRPRAGHGIIITLSKTNPPSANAAISASATGLIICLSGSVPSPINPSPIPQTMGATRTRRFNGAGPPKFEEEAPPIETTRGPGRARTPWQQPGSRGKNGNARLSDSQAFRKTEGRRVSPPFLVDNANTN